MLSVQTTEPPWSLGSRTVRVSSQPVFPLNLELLEGQDPTRVLSGAWLTRASVFERRDEWKCVCVSVSASVPALPSWGPLGQTWLGPHPLCRGAWVGLEVVDDSRAGGEEGRGEPASAVGKDLASLLLSSPVPRRVSPPQGHPTSGTPSSTARGWKTASVPQVEAAPQVPAGPAPHGHGHPCDGRGPGLGTEGQDPFSGPRW